MSARVSKLPDTAYDLLVDALKENGCKSNDGKSWTCPKHDDDKPSLSISEVDDRVLLYCHAKCDTQDVVDALGLKMSDLFDGSFSKDCSTHRNNGTTHNNSQRYAKPNGSASSIQSNRVAVYNYETAGGDTLRRKVRIEPKSFRWEKPGDNGWQKCEGDGNPEILYALPLISEAETVHINEGEKAADALNGYFVKHGLSDHAATCQPTGRWESSYTETLRGKSVVLWADRDEPGIKKAQTIYDELVAAEIPVSVVQSRDSASKADAFDHLKAGFKPEEGEPLELRLNAEQQERVEEGYGSQTDKNSRIIYTTASDVKCTSVSWLWPGRIPSAKLTVLDGDPGLGKSTISIDLAARVSSGRKMPFCDEEWPAGGVMLLSAEDDASDTIVPRLKAAGANLDNVHLVESIFMDKRHRPIQLPLDVPYLKEMIIDCNVRLMVIDPMMAYLGSGTDSYRDQDIRQALMPLSDLAISTGASILFVRHLTKGGSTSNPIYRGGGSIGIVGACRSGLMVGRNPDDDEKRVLASTKNNLAAEAETGSLGYQIINDLQLNTATVSWLGPTEYSATDLLSQPQGEERATVDEASDFLLDLLGNGPVRPTEVQKEAKAAGIAWNAVRRAKDKLGVKSHKESYSGGWVWELPDHQDAELDSQGVEDGGSQKPTSSAPSTSSTKIGGSKSIEDDQIQPRRSIEEGKTGFEHKESVNKPTRRETTTSIPPKTILFDLETTGLLPDVTKIHCGVTFDLQTSSLREFGPDEIDALVEYLKTAEVLAGHNICGFDLPVLEKLYGYNVAGSGQKYLDTMAMSRAIYPGSQSTSVLLVEDLKTRALPPKLRGSHSLKAWSLRLKLGDEGKAEYDGGWKKWNPEMQAYCVRDVKANFKLLEHLLSKDWPIEAHYVESMMSYLLYNQEQYGVGFKEEAANNLVADLSQQRADLTRSLQAVFKPITVPDGPRKQWKKTMVCRKFKEAEDGWFPDRIKGEWYQKTKIEEFNPASTQHIAKRLIDRYGWKPQAFTKKGQVQVTDAILRDLTWSEAQLCADYQVVKKTLAYISEGKAAWLKLVKDGRIHGKVMSTGTVTNRASHSNPNLANVPKVEKAYGKECRALFVAGGGEVPANYKLVGCDASSLQLSIYSHYVSWYDGGELAALCEDENSDPHEFMRKASGLYYRDNQKTLTYATWFGAQHKKQGTIVLDDWRQAYENKLINDPAPGLSMATSLGKEVDARMRINMKGFAEIAEDCKKDAIRGYVTALDDRRIPVKEERLALLNLLQGNEAVVMKNAYVLACERLRDEIEKKLAHPVLWVHDEFQWACEPECADFVGQALSECITEAGEKLGLRLKLGAKYKIGETWAQTH